MSGYSAGIVATAVTNGAARVVKAIAKTPGRYVPFAVLDDTREGMLDTVTGQLYTRNPGQLHWVLTCTMEDDTSG